MTRPATGEPGTQPLTRERLAAVLNDVCATSGIDQTGAHLIKFTNSAVFELPSAGVVVKIAGSPGIAARIPHVLHVARWLGGAGFPSVRLVEDVAQPVRSLGHTATVWHRVNATGAAPTGRDLAVLVRTLHTLPDPGGLPRWTPMEEIRRRIADADGADDDTLAFLTARSDDVEEELGRLRPALRPGPIHGDAFLGNLIAAAKGPVVCDFDSTSIGPREWDLTPVAVGSLRLDYAEDPHPPFAAEYRFDVRQWDGFPTLRRLRELQLVVSVLPVLRGNSAVRAQWEHRMASLRAGDDRRWQPYEDAFRR